MVDTHLSARRRLAAVAGAIAALVAVLLASLALASRPEPGEPGAPSARGAACANGETPAGALSTSKTRRAMRCLVNRERAAEDAARLGRHRSLQKAAQRHARTMAKTGCLAHRCPGEPDLQARVRRAGYLHGADTWRYVEDTGCGPSAKAMVASWLKSQRHRDNLLEPDYRHIGVGTVDDPAGEQCGRGFATFAIVAGWRHPAS